MLINKVVLSSNALVEIRDFYITKLGFHLIENGDDDFTIQVGKSELTFQKSEPLENPFYHFAFNIPHNLFEEAKMWAKSKVTLNREDGDDEVYFEHMDGYSFYFLDPANNVVEFVARNTNPEDKMNTFSTQSIINISEINITTDDVFAVGNQLVKFGIPVRDNEPVEESGLNFIGERQDGAFILLGPPNRRWYFSELLAEAHPLSIQVDKQKNIVVDKNGTVTTFKD